MSTSVPAEPIFADTNLFLRYLTDDVPEQASAVEQLLQAAAAGRVQLIANSLVVAELVWTLESYYRLGRMDIREKVIVILNTPGLEIPGGHLILQALADYLNHNVDFIDAYNRAWMRERELTRICTFDRRPFSRLEGLEVLVPGEEPQEWPEETSPE